MKDLTQRLGATTVATILTIVGGALAAGAWVVTYVHDQVYPVQVQAQQTAVQLAETKNDIQWIKAALDDNGVRPRNQSKISTGTEITQ